MGSVAIECLYIIHNTGIDIAQFLDPFCYFTLDILLQLGARYAEAANHLQEKRFEDAARHLKALPAEYPSHGTSEQCLTAFASRPRVLVKNRQKAP